MDVLVREEAPEDVDAIRRIESSAFETDAEARLVDALRVGGALALSLVAVVDGAVVGHVAFSPVVVSGADGLTHVGVGLGPMAVAAAHQRTGIGSRLVEEGLRSLGAAGQRFFVVLGHADYYPRFGFERASTRGIRWERPVPDEVFLVRALAPPGLDGVAGVVRYRPEFDAV